MRFLALTMCVTMTVAACRSGDPQETSTTEVELTGDTESSSTTGPDGRCERGYLGCECDDANRCYDLSWCNPESGMCKCKVGEEGCACTGGGSCDRGGLQCNPETWTCVYEPGQEGSNCKEDSPCDWPFMCDQETWTCECADGRSGCSCTEGGNCDSPNAVCTKGICQCFREENCACDFMGNCEEGLMCKRGVCQKIDGKISPLPH